MPGHVMPNLRKPQSKVFSMQCCAWLVTEKPGTECGAVSVGTHRPNKTVDKAHPPAQPHLA